MRCASVALAALLLAPPLVAQPLAIQDAFPAQAQSVMAVDVFQPQGVPGEKDTGMALLLAVPPGLFGVCGLGSFYAGDSGHGWRHLGIGVLSMVVAFAVTVDCDGDWYDCSGSEGTIQDIAFLTYLGNLVWSAFVAHKDVKAYNARLRG